MIDGEVFFERFVCPDTAEIRCTSIDLPGKLDVAVGDGADQKAVDDVFDGNLLFG